MGKASSISSEREEGVGSSTEESEEDGAGQGPDDMVRLNKIVNVYENEG